MKKFLTLSAATAAVFMAIALAPADAAVRKTNGVNHGQASNNQVTTDFSARRRYYRRYYGGYYRPYYGGYGYGYGSPYGYGYGPGYYGYGYRPYYRPGITFGFGF